MKIQETCEGKMAFSVSSSSFFPLASSEASNSLALSKWSSIERLFRPVINISSVAPAAIVFFSRVLNQWLIQTIGNISFGLAFVAGKKRVPNPETGKTALVILFILFFNSLMQCNLFRNFFSNRLCFCFVLGT